MTTHPAVDRDIDAAQRTFWRLQAMEAEARERLASAEQHAAAAELALCAAQVRLAGARVATDAFLLDHHERSFRVFHPDDIAAAGSDDDTPLFPDAARRDQDGS